jgi:ADP-heptose:LPS heptosyltransferase
MPKKILMIQLRQLGDILLTTPCIQGLKTQYPTSKISFLCHPMGRLILADNPWLDELICYPSDDFWGEVKLIRQLRRQNYDLVIDFMCNPRSAFYSLAVGRQQRLGMDTRRRFAYTQVVPRSDGSEYIVAEKWRLLAAAGVQSSMAPLHLPVTGKDHQQTAASIWQQSGNVLRVVLSPTHRRAPRRWPLINFAAIADRFVSQWHAEVLWIWGTR